MGKARQIGIGDRDPVHRLRQMPQTRSEDQPDLGHLVARAVTDQADKISAL